MDLFSKNALKKLIRFLGSVYFALILIFSSAVLVILGTFIESYYESHAQAEDTIYASPLFYLLLGGYFLNILISALLRWPFQKKHIPFLITHFGLLMIISGIFVKNLWGIQGTMQLLEGTSSNELTLAGQKSVTLYSQNKSFSFPLYYSFFNGWHFKNSPLKMIEYYPHGEEKWIPKNENKTFIDEYGMKYESAFDTYVAYEEGFKGYAAVAEFQVPIEDPRPHIDHLLKDQLLHYQGKLSPPLQLLKNSLGKKYAQKTISFLRKWKEKNSWLHHSPAAWLKKIKWESIPQEELNGLMWIVELFEKMDEESIMKSFPLQTKEEPSLEAVTKQLFSARDHLPKQTRVIDSSLSSALLSAYFRLFDIHLDVIDLPQPLLKTKTWTIESPLIRKVEKKEPRIKKEENTPLIYVEFNHEILPLVFNSKGSFLKPGTSDQKFLMQFHPTKIAIPYQVCLHQAKDIKYPNSNQTLSYESTLSLNGQLCQLSMNQVYETLEGYRFYLAGMGTVDSHGVKSVQLVINRDPAKYILTYPGAILVSLGIVLLFWFRKK